MIINPTARAELEAAIDAHIASGVKAKAYHPEQEPTPPKSFAEGNDVERAAGLGSHLVGCTDDHCSCPATRPDPVSEKACEDHARLRAAIAILVDLESRYQPQHPGKRPGVGPCPPNKCTDCWKASIERAAAQKRYRTLCRRCGDYRKRNGGPIPLPAIRALAACDGDWSHWSVVRALRSA